MAGNLREDMPETAAFIDALREAFGADHINGQIRKGLNGEPTFHASENGRAIGTAWIKEDQDATNQTD